MKANVKKGDVVMVISGSTKDKQATVAAVDYDGGRVTLEGEGAKKIKKHVKPKRAQDKGGIMEQSGTVHISNVMPICGACGKPTRVGHKEIEENGKKKKVRVCVKCGAVLTSPKLSQPKSIVERVKKRISRRSDKEKEKAGE
ncbi:MAG: 50S ribosomal protein L24 [Clostridiales bacterium]|jgi:large subunit ribosomal protein L24|nr:50S ribosomal protein L24 [Clostridiales bacterium]